jgi:hypothetical protein
VVEQFSSFVFSPSLSSHSGFCGRVCKQATIESHRPSVIKKLCKYVYVCVCTLYVHMYVYVCLCTYIYLYIYVYYIHVCLTMPCLLSTCNS